MQEGEFFSLPNAIEEKTYFMGPVTSTPNYSKVVIP
jgi:hypothetical protein